MGSTSLGLALRKELNPRSSWIAREASDVDLSTLRSLASHTRAWSWARLGSARRNRALRAVLGSAAPMALAASEYEPVRA